jgi:hypothetical protein
MPRQTLIQKSRRVPPAEKAAYHQITGAGRRKVVREFFGVSREDEDAITRTLDERLSRNLR